jgi:hypothetical protein
MGDVWVSQKAEVYAAIIAGHDPEMDRVAERFKSNLLAIMALNRLTGASMESVSIQRVPGLLGNGRLVTDRIIVSTDPGILAINYGHLYRHKNSRRVTYVPGTHAFERALAAT